MMKDLSSFSVDYGESAVVIESYMTMRSPREVLDFVDPGVSRPSQEGRSGDECHDGTDAGG